MTVSIGQAVASASTLSVPMAASLLQSKRMGDLDVSPGRAGDNEISLYFFDPAGAWLSVTSVEVRLTYVDTRAGTMVVQAIMLHPGHAFIAGNHLRHAGRWQVAAVFKTCLDDTVGAFQLTVR
ncbi:MAG TPA: hypothetical protein VJB57_03945 [Dehalococcoidia bacterium]|nr:hypothetical protein [Dehalococcoidia bacterium]